jgi:membrane protein YqaA with SNARE-associated domain
LEAFTGWMNSDLSLWGLFLSSLLGATLLPGGSELVLVGVLKLHPESFWPALMFGSIGNTLGGMISFGMGWLLPQTQQLKHVSSVRRYGTPTMLFAWLPFVGDALCVAAGWLRLNPWQAALFMLAGKFARYALIGFSV